MGEGPEGQTAARGEHAGPLHPRCQEAAVAIAGQNTERQKRDSETRAQVLPAWRKAGLT